MKIVNLQKTKYSNSFDEVRLILAVIVFLAHTSVLASVTDLQWFLIYFDSTFAISGFFALSGYLVTLSYLRSTNYKQYFEKRLRRIYPAYIFTIFYCILIGIMTTEYNIYTFFTNFKTFQYLLANLSFMNFLQPTLPGSLTQNDISALNGSLWTIKVEIMLYICIPLIVLLYNKLGVALTASAIFLFGITYFIYFTGYFDHNLGATIARQFPGQLPFFVLGSALSFIVITKLDTLFIILLSCIYYFYLSTLVSEYWEIVLNMVFYPIFIITVAKSYIFSIRIGRIGDLSYGIYLFHFPTIQYLEHLGVYAWNAWIGFIISIIMTLSMATISWHMIEKKFLQRS